MIDPLKLAYLAGFVDGEGWIGVYSSLRTDNHRRYFRLVCSVAQKNPAILSIFKKHFGGTITPPYTAHVSTWSVTGRQAETFLKQILPYMRGKSVVARFALRYRRLVNNAGKKATIKDKRQMMSISKRISAINQRD